MEITFLEQVNIICSRKGISKKDLARLLNCTPQNLNNKFTRNDFKMSDMKKIADVLGCDLKIELSEKP